MAVATRRWTHDHRRHRAASPRGSRATRSGWRWSAPGFMGQGLANQIVNSVPGMRLVAVSNRNPDARRQPSATRGRPCRVRRPRTRSRTRSVPDRPAFTDDPYLLCRSEQVDVVCEVTGDVEYATPVVLEAFAHGKDVVLMNAEIDATIGPILQVYAEQSRRHPVRVRRRRAGRADEPLPLGQGPRARASRDRQRQGPSGSVPEPDDAAGLRRAVGPVGVDGDVVRRRLEDLVRAGDRRERDGIHGACSAACHAVSSTAAT